MCVHKCLSIHVGIYVYIRWGLLTSSYARMTSVVTPAIVYVRRRERFFVVTRVLWEPVGPWIQDAHRCGLGLQDFSILFSAPDGNGSRPASAPPWLRITAQGGSGYAAVLVLKGKDFFLALPLCGPAWLGAHCSGWVGWWEVTWEQKPQLCGQCVLRPWRVQLPRRLPALC